MKGEIVRLAHCRETSRIRRSTSLSLLVALAGWAACAQEPVSPSDPIAVTLEGSFNFGSIDGFLQTPSGGHPGSSSRERPKFDELGIDDVMFYDTALAVQWRRFLFYGGYQFIRLTGSDTLSQPLVSHGAVFPAGDHVTTKDRFDWARFGLGWSFGFLDHRIDLTPKAELVFLNFSYKLSTESQSVDRSYIKGTARIGIQAAYRFNPMLSANIDGAASLPLSHTPQIATVSATANFHLAPQSHTVKPRFFVGVGMEWIDYQDDQPLPNHIRADIGPFLTAGLGLSF